MGTAASCHVACTSEQAVEVAPSLYPFALPARASPRLRELVEAVRSCSALDDLEQVRLYFRRGVYANSMWSHQVPRRRPSVSKPHTGLASPHVVPGRSYCRL
jgi:hypothetical protein